VDERVLIPRPETEELALQVVNSLEDGYEVLDLCTGSGAIAIAVQKELQKRGVKVKMTASDISEEALALAQENAEENHARIEFIRSDLFEKVRGKFDIIVTNPPYIPTATIETLQREVRNFEPRLALDGGEDGLDCYRKIAASAGRHIVRGGTLIMEVGEGEARAVAKLFKGDHYTIIGKDFNGIERYVKIIY
jgi:release factor glutamine methyltransferase